MQSRLATLFPCERAKRRFRLGVNLYSFVSATSEYAIPTADLSSLSVLRAACVWAPGWLGLRQCDRSQGWRKAEVAANYMISGLGVALAVLGGGLSIKKSFF